MANPWEGQVAIVLDGERYVMRLTLAALAELEDGLSDGNIVALVERFEAGSFSTRDVVSVIVAGLRGGGWRGEARELLAVEIDGGLPKATRLAGELRVRAFSFPNQ